jgi:acyl carrier protein
MFMTKLTLNKKYFMDIDEFLERIKPELLDSGDSITAETRFRDLEEWDSLTGMSILVLLEESYGKNIPADIFKSCNTFEDIFNYINKK